MELQMVLPTPDSDEKNGLNLLRRLWVVKFDRAEEIRLLAERSEAPSLCKASSSFPGPLQRVMLFPFGASIESI